MLLSENQIEFNGEIEFESVPAYKYDTYKQAVARER